MHSADGTVRPVDRAFAWAGMLLFFASLSFFLLTYAVTFGEPPSVGRETALLTGNANDPRVIRAVVINIALFTVFALHHSIFARERLRAWVARVVRPHLERAAYVWIASLMFIAVCALWQPLPGVAWQLTEPWRWLGLTVQGIGVWLTISSAAAIDILELSGVRQLARRKTAFTFKTTGPYGWVRHPIYTGWFLLVFGAPTMTMTRLLFAVVSSAYLLIAIPFEERSLRRAAGDAYEVYSRQVRWKLIPHVY